MNGLYERLGFQAHWTASAGRLPAEVRARYGGLRSEQLQARMLADGDEPDSTAVEHFCERARELFRAMTDNSIEGRS